MKIRIVGRGKVGRALAHALRGAGVQVTLLGGRSVPSARSMAGVDAVLLCVPDAAIASTSARLDLVVPDRVPFLHVAGARGADEARPTPDSERPVGAMHPMVSFAPNAFPIAFEGTVFVVGGDRRAVRAGTAVARAVGARAVRAEVHGATYHAAAALAANGAVGLANEAVRWLLGLGLARRDAEHAIAGLLATVATNVRVVGVPAALTGPVVRGDAETVARHRQLLASIDARALAAYDGSAPTVLACAIDAGLERTQARAIERALVVPLTPPRRRRSADRTRAPSRRSPRGA